MESEPLKFWSMISDIGLMDEVIEIITAEIDRFPALFRTDERFRAQVSDLLTHLTVTLNLKEQIGERIEAKQLEQQTERDAMQREMEELKRKAELNEKREGEMRRWSQLLTGRASHETNIRKRKQGGGCSEEERSAVVLDDSEAQNLDLLSLIEFDATQLERDKPSPANESLFTSSEIQRTLLETPPAANTPSYPPRITEGGYSCSSARLRMDGNVTYKCSKATSLGCKYRILTDQKGVIIRKFYDHCHEPKDSLDALYLNCAKSTPIGSIKIQHFLADGRKLKHPQIVSDGFVFTFSRIYKNGLHVYRCQLRRDGCRARVDVDPMDLSVVSYQQNIHNHSGKNVMQSVEDEN